MLFNSRVDCPSMTMPFMSDSSLNVKEKFREVVAAYGIKNDSFGTTNSIFIWEGQKIP